MSWHVFRVGWVHEPDPTLGIRVHSPDQVRVYEDPATARARVAEVLRKRAEAENPPYEPWPAPEVPMRIVEAADVPSAPASLSSALRAAGWSVVVTYARGTLTRARDGFTGRGADRRSKHYPAKIVGSWAVRAASPGRRAVAIWHESGGKLAAQAVLCWGDAPARWIGVEAFKKGL
jgi:hypothetical protein